jgi:hypothetical protein
MRARRSEPNDVDGREDRYRLSLRIWHPTQEPRAISARLGLEPSVEWSAGSPRRSPTGAPLDGVHTTTYWSSRLGAGSGDDLPKALEEATTSLEAHGDFLRLLRDTGGRVEFFVGWFFSANAGALLPHTLLARMGPLGVSLALDVYGATAEAPAEDEP